MATQCITKCYIQPEEGETELTKQIKSNILNYLNNKYNDPVTQELLDMASLMDPRFRTTYIADDEVDGIKKRAVTELMSLPAEKSKSQPGTSVQDLLQEEAAEPVTKKKKTLASFFKKKTVTPTSQSEQDKIEAELSSYLLSSETDPDTDPLQWWKVHEANFPRLSNLARKYLSIPATSAPLERVFSTGGNIVTCQRACLKPEAVERLVFLAKNL